MNTSQVEQIQFGTKDLVIEGPTFKYVTSMITPASQGSRQVSTQNSYAKLTSDRLMTGPGNKPTCFSFGNDLMPTNSVSSVVPDHHRFKLKHLEVYDLK